MPLIARQRSRLAVLAVLALVGSLLAVSAVPVAAEDGKADNEAVYSACAGAAMADAGFTDMDGSFAEAAANCLAHYGITTGTSEGVFSPTDSITRLQMALFLSRAAGPAGIELLDPAKDQGFDDIAGLADFIQDAINQVAELEIMTGTDGSFSPMADVNREDMATFLDAFLANAILGPGAIGGGINDDKYSGDNADVEPDDKQFTDIDRVPRVAYEAIRRLYEVGVAQGTTDTTFGPSELVNRGQMAVFISRMLAHTNARPAGLTIQAEGDATADSDSTIAVHVSLRGDDHQPVADAIIDAFRTSAPADAFNDDGTCDVSSDGVAHEGGTDTCQIDASDEITDPDGNLIIDPPGTSAGAVTLWVWTGKSGDTYDDDETTKATIELSYTKPASMVRVTDTMDKHAVALKFGDSITFTFQVVNEDGNAVTEKDVAINVVSMERAASPTADTTAMARLDIADGSTGYVAPFRSLNTEYMTNADGQVEVTFGIDDLRPMSGDGGDLGRLDLDVTLDASSTLTLSDMTERKVIDDGDGDVATDPVIEWRDTPSAPTSLALGLPQSYHLVSTAGSGASSSVTATLVNQYGDPISRAKVRFYSDATETVGSPPVSLNTLAGMADGSTGPKPRSTNRNGVATQSYSRSAAGVDVETINAQYVQGPCNDEDSDCPDGLATGVTDVADISAMAVMHYWGVSAPAGTPTNALPIVVRDTDSNTIVLSNGTNIYIVSYKSIDAFEVVNTGTATGVLATGTRTMDTFVSTLNALSTAQLAESSTTLNVTLSGSRKVPGRFVLAFNIDDT